MNTKLTLSVEKKIIETAKEYAKNRGQSLSELVENYFKLITKEKETVNDGKLSPRVKELVGIISVPEDFEYKKVLTEELSKKYDH